VSIHLILAGVVGSTAYGMAGPDSDVDRLGVFTRNTTEFFTLEQPPETITGTHPDVCYHEAAKMARLLLDGNPTVTELLWLEQYETKAPVLGDELIALRSAVLSAPRVREAYLGYAGEQFRRLLRAGRFGSDIPDRRTAKHARHLMRLVGQGYELYTTGRLTIRLANPQACIAFGEAVADDPERARAYLADAEDLFNRARTCLPERPSAGAVAAWLRNVRAAHYTLPRPSH
jgi:predicted nucleotidyltransferase